MGNTKIIRFIVAASFFVSILVYPPVARAAELDQGESVKAETISSINLVSSENIEPLAIAPETYYVSGVSLWFSGSSAPATMYYQKQEYGRLYRGYLTRDYYKPIIWGALNTGYTVYYGTLYRNDLPLPSLRRVLPIEEE